MYVEGDATLVEGNRQHLGDTFGHANRRGQAQHRAFPRGERPFGGDVADGSDVHVFVGDVRRDPVDVDGYPFQTAVSMPDRRLVLDLVLLIEAHLLLPRRLLVDQPRVWPPVGDTVGRVAGDLAECVVDLGDGPFVIGDEESLLQRVHQCVLELVAIGQVFGPGPLFLVTLCAV